MLNLNTRILLLVFFMSFLTTSCYTTLDNKRNVARNLKLDAYSFRNGGEWSVLDSMVNDKGISSGYSLEYTDEKNNTIFQLAIKTYKTEDDKYMYQSFDTFLGKFIDNTQKQYSPVNYKGPFLSYKDKYQGFYFRIANLYSSENYSLKNRKKVAVFALAHDKRGEDTADILLFCLDKRYFDKIDSFFKSNCLDKLIYTGNNKRGDIWE